MSYSFVITTVRKYELYVRWAFLLKAGYCVGMSPPESMKSLTTSSTPSKSVSKTLAHLRRLLTEMAELLEAKEAFLPDFDTWQGDVRVVLDQYYGRTSLHY